MKNRITLILAAICLLGTIVNTYSQQKPDLLDPAIRYGVLPNGLTYYILHNEEPKERASFYIVQNVGAILEDDDQNGLAHMLEHMAFNGSTNFPEKGVKNFLERNGVQFGSNINAYTSMEETVYNISNVPTTKTQVMDSCVVVLHDWSGFLTLSDKEIDAERGVINEEWRTRNNASRRMQKTLSSTVFNQSKYAVRDVIGDMNIIENSPYSAIRSFYKKWYRPDLQAVVIVGDFDTDAMEARVKKILSNVPTPQNPAERKEYTIPDNADLLYAYATDEEAQYIRYNMLIKHDAVKKQDKNEEYLLMNLMVSLYSSVVNERLSEIQQKSTTPFLGARIGYYNFVRTKDIYSLSGVKPENTDLMGSMKALMIENERVKRHGITSTELSRAKIKQLKRYQEALKEKKEVSNDMYASSIQDHYLTGEPKPSMEFMLEFVESKLPQITAEKISQLAKQWNKDNNITITINGPKKVSFEYPTKTQIVALLDEVKNTDLEPFVDNVVDAPLISKEPTPGKILSSKALKGTPAKEYTLSNGAKVVVYPTDKNDNEIIFRAYSKGGTSLISDKDLPTATLATSIARGSGIGAHNLADLRKILTGKQASVRTRIGGLSEGLSGGSTPEDIETMLQLIYLSFEAPRFEKEPFESSINRMKLGLKNAASNPKKIFQDSISYATSGGNLARNPIFTLDLIDKLSFEKCETIYKDRMSNAGDFVFAFVGAVDEKTLLPLVEKYIASISDNNRRENWKDNGVRPFTKNYKKVFSKEMKTPKQTNYIKFFGTGKYTLQNDMVMTIARSILQQRYFDTVREEEGGSYGVNVSAGFSATPYDNYSLSVYFDCNPDKADKLVNIIHEELNKLLENGPAVDDYNKVVESLVKKREQSLEQNGVYLSGIMSLYSKGYNTALPENHEAILAKMNIKKFIKLLNKIMKNRDSLTVIMQPEQR